MLKKREDEYNIRINTYLCNIKRMWKDLGSLQPQ